MTLLRVTEPMEDRMEKAQFSPSLSKQRVKYAVDRIKESSATFLVDFGCGSGSLLDSLLHYPTSLERIVGVDISTKALTRAAKTLHTKLSNNATVPVQSSHLKSALILDGSIA
ncbi:small RNA 2'-O-methyltransferase [Tanacetum coccineum]|uniref:Small RNA 2'-O-methyltransferase n=1 Tax=Tanacetum coccineum TaxID=301880 RepID=A0ABQ4ZF39_9ASTR